MTPKCWIFFKDPSRKSILWWHKAQLDYWKLVFFKTRTHLFCFIGMKYVFSGKRNSLNPKGSKTKRHKQWSLTAKIREKYLAPLQGDQNMTLSKTIRNHVTLPGNIRNLLSFLFPVNDNLMTTLVCSCSIKSKKEKMVIDHTLPLFIQRRPLLETKMRRWTFPMALSNISLSKSFSFVWLNKD